MSPAILLKNEEENSDSQSIRDQVSRAFHGLERHIAGETIGHNHVDVTREDVVSFDEADVVEPARAQQCMRCLHDLVALHVFFADVEKTPRAAQLAP